MIYQPNSVERSKQTCLKINSDLKLSRGDPAAFDFGACHILQDVDFRNKKFRNNEGEQSLFRKASVFCLEVERDRTWSVEIQNSIQQYTTVYLSYTVQEMQQWSTSVSSQ